MIPRPSPRTKLKLPGKAPRAAVSVVQLEFARPFVIEGEAYPVGGKDGAIHLTAYDADTHGNWTGNMQLTGSGESAKLTGWTAEEWWVEYLFKTTAAGGEWKNLELATVELPASVTRFELRAEEDSWNGGPDLRNITVALTSPHHP